MNALHDNASTGRQAPRWLLVAGLATGAAMAGFGLKAPAGASLPPGAVARVNQHLIPRDAWLRAVAAVASERRAPLSDADQRQILDRLVDEELLVQHGVELGLVESDARLRSTVVSEVMAGARSAALVDEAAQRRFYDDNRQYFAPAGRLRVQAWRAGADGSRQPFAPAVPNALLPVAKLQAYLGPQLTAIALDLAPGETSAPVNGVALQLLEAQPGAAPPFENIRDAVGAEMRRRADEAAVRELLARLRGNNDVVVAP